MWNGRKRQSRHRCSKKTKGKPHCGNGVCYGFREAVRERYEGRKLVHLWKQEKDPEASDL
jgi:hypothetical protein